MQKDICGVYNYGTGAWLVSPKKLQFKKFGLHDQKRGAVDLEYVQLLDDKVTIDVYRDKNFLSILASEKNKKSLKTIAGLTLKGSDPVQLELQQHRIAILCNANDGPFNNTQKKP